MIPVIDRVRARFAIARVCMVADRGMISAKTLVELEARRLLYILGVRERTDKLVRELVLDDPEPFVPLVMQLIPQPRHRPIEMMQIVLRYDRCRIHPCQRLKCLLSITRRHCFVSVFRWLCASADTSRAPFQRIAPRGRVGISC
jgi:hypothetical protein